MYVDVHNIVIALAIVGMLALPVGISVDQAPLWLPASMAGATFFLLAGRLVSKTIDTAAVNRPEALRYAAWNLAFNVAVTVGVYSIASGMMTRS